MTMTTSDVNTCAAPELRLTLPDAGLRLGADSARPRYIPIDFNEPDRLVFPYIDGRYKWPAAQLRRFDRAIQVPITVTGDPAAEIADVETGDMGPAEFVTWLKNRLDHGERWHALYSSIDSKPLVDQAVADAGLPRGLFGWFAANPTSRPHILPGSVATQYDWLGGYDISLVTPGWHPVLIMPAA